MEIDGLVQAVTSLNAVDAFRARLSSEQWRTIAPYLNRHDILYFLAQRSLQVFVSAAAHPSHRVAILRAGSVVGEAGLFGDGPRLANVAAMTPCVVWALRGPRLEELSQRSPALALELLRAAGAVLGARIRAYLARQTPLS